MAVRSVTITISVGEGEITFKQKKSETIKDPDTGQSHTESESASTEFGVYKSARDAATLVLDAFEKGLKQPEGELFA